MGNKYNYGNNIYDVLMDPLHKYSFSRGEIIAIICCVNFLWLAIAVIVVAAYYRSIQMRLFMGGVIYLPSAIYNYFAIRKLHTITTVIKNGDRFPAEILSYQRTSSSRTGITHYKYSLEVSYGKRKRVVSEGYTDDPCYSLASTKCIVYIYHGKCFVSDFKVRTSGDPFTDIPER